MCRVPQSEVIRSWLRMERHRPNSGVNSEAETTDLPPIETLSDRAVLDELLDHKPGAAAFIWRDAPIEWFALRLDRETFERLHVIEGPNDLRWRALSPDDTVVGAARRIAREEPDELTAETGVNIRRVLQFRASLPDGPLVLATRQGCTPITVADGNHRAVALALRLLDGEYYQPPRAYLGIGANPVLRPLLERVCGVVQRTIK